MEIRKGRQENESYLPLERQTAADPSMAMALDQSDCKLILFLCVSMVHFLSITANVNRLTATNLSSSFLISIFHTWIFLPIFTGVALP